MRIDESAFRKINCLLLVACLYGCGTNGTEDSRGKVVVHKERERNLDKAIIFVHGIWGSKDTWSNQQAGTSWPALMMTDEEFNDYDIFRVDYHTHFWSGKPASTMEITEGLSELMKTSGIDNYDEIFFICHSMGGNIVRQYLINVKLSEGHLPLQKYRKTFFLGTPVKGSSIAGVAKLVSSDPKLGELVPEDNNTYLESLNNSWTKVKRKRKVQGYPNLEIFAGYERKPMPVVGLIVDEGSASYLSTGNKGFEKNHMELVKPGDHTDSVYEWVRELITE